MNIKMLMQVVLKSLGITQFNKDSSGNYALFEDEKKKLAGIFGQAFTDKFAEALSKEEVEAATTTAPGAAAPGTTTPGAEELVDALRAHHASVVETGMRDLRAQLAQALKDKETLQATVATLSEAPEFTPTAEGISFKGKDGKKIVMKVDKTHAHYQGVEQFLSTGHFSHIEAATIDVGQLKTEFGKYLSQNGNNLDIINQIFLGFTSSKYFTPKVATTEYRAVQALITSVSQQFSAKWNPGGKTKFTPLVIKNFRHKINYPIVPAEVLDSYMFHLYNEKLSPDQMPIVTYIWDTLIYPALLMDIELRMIWKGKFVDHQATNDEGDVATPPEDSMDGLETILVEHSTNVSSKMNFFQKFPDFDWDTATDQEVLDFIAGFVAWLSPFYKNSTNMPLFLAPERKTRYKTAYKNKWGAGAGLNQGDGGDKIDFSNQMLEAPVGMFGSPIIFSTPLPNMVKLWNKNAIPNVINDVQKHNYEVRIFGEYWLGAGFAIQEAVFAYVPTGYNPKELISAALGDHDDYQSWKGLPEASDESGI